MRQTLLNYARCVCKYLNCSLHHKIRRQDSMKRVCWPIPMQLVRWLWFVSGMCYNPPLPQDDKLLTHVILFYGSTIGHDDEESSYVCLVVVVLYVGWGAYTLSSGNLGCHLSSTIGSARCQQQQQYTIPHCNTMSHQKKSFFVATAKELNALRENSRLLQGPPLASQITCYEIPQTR